ncbi:MAG: hypothetical protein QM786_07405 [Breznakibacter sp.]
MRKTVLVLFALMLGTVAFAQINDHALGLRLGGSNSVSNEISYQHGLSNKNRFEADLGLRNHKYYSAFSLSGVYQWVWGIESGFSWYAGVGGQLGSWSWKDKYSGDDDSGTWLAVLGQIGIEYQFTEIPIQISIDTRPSIGLVNYNSELGYWDLALGIRYTF